MGQKVEENLPVVFKEEARSREHLEKWYLALQAGEHPLFSPAWGGPSNRKMRGECNAVHLRLQSPSELVLLPALPTH